MNESKAEYRGEEKLSPGNVSYVNGRTEIESRGIPAELDKLHKEIERVACVVDDCGMRLAPITSHHAKDQGAYPKEDEREPGSTISQKIREMRDQLEANRRSLEMLLDRIEL